MKALVLGGGGMLGHKMVQVLHEAGHELAATFRRTHPSSRWFRGLLREITVVSGCDAEEPQWVSRVIDDFVPEAVLNCIGIVKQRGESKDHLTSLRVNSVFPHHVASVCSDLGIRLVHFSTDCVFDGAVGQYREDAEPTARDLYGRTKFLGEVTRGSALTLRTSIIGRELEAKRSLLEWFLAHRGSSVDGYQNTLYSGLTTNHLSSVVAWLLESHPSLSGLFHVSGHPISKYDLLLKLKGGYDLPIEIRPQEFPVIDRTLDGGLFVAETGYSCPSWDDLCEELASDTAQYPD